MREPRWGTRRPTAGAAVVGLVVMVVLAAVAPSSWSSGWRATDAAVAVVDSHPGMAHQSTAPRLLPGGTEHLPTPAQPRALSAVGAAAALLVLLPIALFGAGPVTGCRRGARRVVTPRSPPLP
ncbi:hypothetical protein ACFOWE_11075 [Planomonospora corallina]|uniref:Uncharacterized protein n=1 Tax=Planomonospora corallina TaxID=1806052 RepID=A0ABV8I765_9ACTN